jgi:bifunctional DNA-binding transcriptional regulator/antitoxin component of YhaV-PrlF toxin-antitoxin module
MMGDPGKIEIKVCLRTKNQLTLPEPIAKRLGVGPGDRLIFHFDENETDVVHLRPLLRSYAGIAAGGYGTPEEVAEYLQHERAAWGE